MWCSINASQYGRFDILVGLEIAVKGVYLEIVEKSLPLIITYLEEFHLFITQPTCLLAIARAIDDARAMLRAETKGQHGVQSGILHLDKDGHPDKSSSLSPNFELCSNVFSSSMAGLFSKYASALTIGNAKRSFSNYNMLDHTSNGKPAIDYLNYNAKLSMSDHTSNEDAH